MRPHGRHRHGRRDRRDVPRNGRDRRGDLHQRRRRHHRPRQSTDGGATFHRGTAIDVTGRPNRTVINLLGDGQRHLRQHRAAERRRHDQRHRRRDAVQRHHQLELHAGGGVDGRRRSRQPAQNSCGVGTLNINNGGNLTCHPRSTGDPTMSTVRPTPSWTRSTIGCRRHDHLRSAGRLPAERQPVGTYPQVFVGHCVPRRHAGREHRAGGRPVRHHGLRERDRRQRPHRHVRPVRDRRHSGGLAAARLRLHLRQPEQRRPGADPDAVQRGPWPQPERRSGRRRVSSASSTST